MNSEGDKLKSNSKVASKSHQLPIPSTNNIPSTGAIGNTNNDAPNILVYKKVINFISSTQLVLCCYDGK